MRLALQEENLSARAADRECDFAHDTIAGCLRGEMPTLEEAIVIERRFGVAASTWLKKEAQ